MPLADGIICGNSDVSRDAIGKDANEILSFTAFGFEASEPMAVVQTTMIGRKPYTMLPDTIFTHATVSEGLIGLVEQVKAAKG